MTEKPVPMEKRRAIAALIDALCALVVAALCASAAWHGYQIFLLGLWMLAWAWHGASRGFVSPLILGAMAGAAPGALLTSPGAVVVRPVNGAIVGAVVAGAGGELYRRSKSRKSSSLPKQGPASGAPNPPASKSGGSDGSPS